MAETEPHQKERLDVKTSSSPSVLFRKDGRQLKRMTLYLPVDLARELAHHCVERDSDVSAIAAMAIARYLTPSK